MRESTKSIMNTTDAFFKENSESGKAKTVADWIVKSIEISEDKFKPKWISVKDALPENRLQTVLVYGRKENQVWCIQTSSAMGNGKFEIKEVSHWMPLPDPPKDI